MASRSCRPELSQQTVLRAPDTASEPLKSSSGEVRPLRWHWKCLFDSIWRSDLLGGNEWRRTFYLWNAAASTSTLTSMYRQIHLVSMCLGSVCMSTWMWRPENNLKSYSVGAIHLVLETDSLSSLELVLILAGWSARSIWDLPISVFSGF